MVFGHESTHWMYVCQKLDGAEQKCLENWGNVIAEIEFEMEMEQKTLTRMKDRICS